MELKTYNNKYCFYFFTFFKIDNYNIFFIERQITYISEGSCDIEEKSALLLQRISNRNFYFKL